MGEFNTNVSAFMTNTTNWKDEYNKLRSIVIKHDLDEEFKWYQPCYSFQNGIVLILGGFKNFISIGFFKGSLLSDPYHILVKPGDNTQSSRLLKFTSVIEIEKNEKIIDEYIKEAIEIERAGLKINYTPVVESDYPLELLELLDKSLDFKKAFESLTPGRRKGYILYFSAPKQSITRISRIEKYRDKIMDGKGINDF